jgi:hypothetical protein
MIEQEGVGRVCTDQTINTLQRLALELVDEIAADHVAHSNSNATMAARCKALSAKLFSPTAAVK